MSKQPAPAWLASTVLLLRDGMEGLEVFMVVRNDAIVFASGALVFPGGRVDEADHALAARPERCPLLAGVREAALVTRVAAIRETFEECGILLARPAGSDRLVSAEQLDGIALRHRVRLAAGEVTLAEVVDAEDLVLATDLLVAFAHWITPAVRPKRFDTHFFLAAAPADQVGAHDGHESVDSVWISPAKALAEVAVGTYKMMFPTHRNLVKLGRSLSLAAALAAARAAPIVTVEPEVLKNPDGTSRLRIPLAADYGGEEFAADLPASVL
jgi:8-oxo-dGTP pyrophosphatase MutT (NUDIX family)